jgi:hypothetical protein
VINAGVIAACNHVSPFGSAAVTLPAFRADGITAKLDSACSDDGTPAIKMQQPAAFFYYERIRPVNCRLCRQEPLLRKHADTCGCKDLSE